jgi:hypothetical protein
LDAVVQKKTPLSKPAQASAGMICGGTFEDRVSSEERAARVRPTASTTVADGQIGRRDGADANTASIGRKS